MEDTEKISTYWKDYLRWRYKKSGDVTIVNTGN